MAHPVEAAKAAEIAVAPRLEIDLIKKIIHLRPTFVALCSEFGFEHYETFCIDAFHLEKDALKHIAGHVLGRLVSGCDISIFAPARRFCEKVMRKPEEPDEESLQRDDEWDPDVALAYARECSARGRDCVVEWVDK